MSSFSVERNLSCIYRHGVSRVIPCVHRVCHHCRVKIVKGSGFRHFYLGTVSFLCWCSNNINLSAILIRQFSHCQTCANTDHRNQVVTAAVAQSRQCVILRNHSDFWPRLFSPVRSFVRRFKITEIRFNLKSVLFQQFGLCPAGFLLFHAKFRIIMDIQGKFPQLLLIFFDFFMEFF